MTILWIYNQPLVPEAGGTERVTSLVAKGLTERGHNCMGILVFNENDGSMTYDSTPISDLYEFLKANKVDIIINQIAYAKWLLEAFLAKGGQRWHAEGGRIISCLHFDPCNPSEFKALSRKESKSLNDYLKLAKLAVFNRHYKNRQQRGEGEVYNYIYDNSDAFVALSPTHFDYLRKVMKREYYDQLHAIGNPLTFDVELTTDELDRKKNTVLVCGRMSEYHKRISIILEAWRRLQRNGNADDWTLKIVGEGPDLERYKRYVRKNSLRNVNFEGHQNPEPYYREAKILLLTSSAEGWGLVLTEALQYGVVPVVMNSSSVYNEIISHHYDGILTPNNNLKLFSTAIAQLIEDPRRLDAMQCNALRSSKKFTLEKEITKWEKLLNQLCGNQKDYSV